LHGRWENLEPGEYGADPDGTLTLVGTDGCRVILMPDAVLQVSVDPSVTTRVPPEGPRLTRDRSASPTGAEVPGGDPLLLQPHRGEVWFEIAGRRSIRLRRQREGTAEEILAENLSKGSVSVQASLLLREQAAVILTVFRGKMRLTMAGESVPVDG